MILRVQFFEDWIERGKPYCYWISSFYFPQGFLTSVLQGYSREKQIPVDRLAFEFNLLSTSETDEIDDYPEEGIFVHGIFMDGSAWDFDLAVIAPQDYGVMFVKAPIVNM